MPEYDDGKFNQDDWLFNEQYGYYQNELPEILKDPIYGNGKRGMPIPSYLQNLSSDEVVKQAQAERQKRIDWFKQNWYSQQDKVAQLSPTDKLLEAVNRAAILLPEALAEEIKALFTPETLATMVAILGVYLAAHATGIGQAFDIGMLIAGGIYFGLDAFAIFKHLAGFANAINATSEEELDDAAEDLAWAIAKVGVDALWTLLTKKVADEVGKTVDHVNQVDEVHAHSDDINAGNLVPFNELKYPEGTYNNTNLPNHLRNFEGINRSGVRGTHRLDIFNQVVKDEGLEIISKIEHPDIKGIYNIQYKVPKQDGSGDFRAKPQKKTVYDPAIHSDDKILELGQRAAAQGMEKAIAEGNRQFIENVEGIDFLVSINLNTREITNTHPIMD